MVYDEDPKRCLICGYDITSRSCLVLFPECLHAMHRYCRRSYCAYVMDNIKTGFNEIKCSTCRLTLASNVDELLIFLFNAYRMDY